MPTSSQFTAMAVTAESMETSLSGAAANIGAAVGLASIQGGDLAQLVSQTVEQSTLNITTIRTRLGELAALCRDRAVQCERYSNLYDGYERAAAAYAAAARNLEPGQWLGSPPYPPMRPGPWADRG